MIRISQDLVYLLNSLDISAFSDEISQSKGALSPLRHEGGFRKATPPHMDYKDTTLDESAILGDIGNDVLDSMDSKLPEINLDDSPRRAVMARGGGGNKVVPASHGYEDVGIEGVGMAAFEDDMKAQQQHRYM